MSPAEPSPGGEIKRERRERPTSGSKVEKVGGTDTHRALVLLPPSAEGRQDPTPSLFDLAKILAFKLSSAPFELLHPNANPSLHSALIPSAPFPTMGRVFIRTFPKKGPLMSLREESWVQRRAKQIKSKLFFSTLFSPTLSDSIYCQVPVVLESI